MHAMTVVLGAYSSDARSDQCKWQRKSAQAFAMYCLSMVTIVGLTLISDPTQRKHNDKVY